MAKKNEDKIYTHCKGCAKQLLRPSTEPLCQRCRVLEFDEERKQNVTLDKFIK